ncbi:hypothetical protein O3P69_007986 [Scylla paramamosain]|uniref:Fucosyltransferase n=1 Tax=Scylla paramamosain TaxID=85552 RepID=A0AAW0T381_SCYPA
MKQEKREKSTECEMARCRPVSMSTLAVVVLILCLMSWGHFLFLYDAGTGSLLHPTQILPAPLTNMLITATHPSARDTPPRATPSHSNAANTRPVAHSSDSNNPPSATNIASHDTAFHIDATNVPTNSRNDNSKATNSPFQTKKEQSNATNTYSKIKGNFSKTSNTPSKTKINQPKATNIHSKIEQEQTKDTNTPSRIGKGQTRVTRTGLPFPQITSPCLQRLHGLPRNLAPSAVSSTRRKARCGEWCCGRPSGTSGTGWKGMLRDHGALREGRCAIWRCEFLLGTEVTTEQIKEAYAIIFFSLDVKAQPLPPRFPHTLWIWLELESPIISIAATKSWSQFEASGVFFNLTMSYHHLNHIVALAGELVPLSTPQHCPISSSYFFNTSSPTYTSYNHHMDQFESWLRERGVVADEKLRAERSRRHGSLIYRAKDNTTLTQPRSNDQGEKKVQGNETSVMEEGSLTLTPEEIALATRPRVAVWMASHCPTDSRREDMVAELQGFMAVTTVGKCGKLKCGKNHMDDYCYQWLAASHLFYLSFENALCDDYITEKMWTPMKHGMVPVVYGGANYHHILPFDSYIDVSNFSSLAALANHLLYLATHPAAYLRHLQWRRYWQVRRLVPWCDLCTAIHRQTHPARATLDQWWNTTATCYAPPRWRKASAAGNSSGSA